MQEAQRKEQREAPPVAGRLAGPQRQWQWFHHEIYHIHQPGELQRHQVVHSQVVAIEPGQYVHQVCMVQLQLLCIHFPLATAAQSSLSIPNLATTYILTFHCMPSERNRCTQKILHMHGAQRPNVRGFCYLDGKNSIFKFLDNDSHHGPIHKDAGEACLALSFLRER